MSALFGQSLRFAVVGLAATAVHVGVALALAAAGWAPLWANFVAFGAALALSYFGNHGWTFGAGGRHGHHFPRFVALALAGLALNQAIVFIAVERAGWSFGAALAVVVLVVPVLSFALNRVWVFPARRLAR